MIKSIIIGVLLSFVIWAITFDHFFDHNRIALTLIVALGIGVLAGILVSALKKPGSTSPSSGLLLLIVAAGTIGILFGISKIVSRQTCAQPTPPINVTCDPVAAAKPVRVCADRKTDIDWITKDVGTGIKVKIHDFKRKQWWGGYVRKSPLVSDPGEGNNSAPIKGKIKDTSDNHGLFKYSVTCTPGNTEDPMIEVPK